MAKKRRVKQYSDDDSENDDSSSPTNNKYKIPKIRHDIKETLESHTASIKDEQVDPIVIPPPVETPIVSLKEDRKSVV